MRAHFDEVGEFPAPPTIHVKFVAAQTQRWVMEGFGAARELGASHDVPAFVEILVTCEAMATPEGCAALLRQLDEAVD